MVIAHLGAAIRDVQERERRQQILVLVPLVLSQPSLRLPELEGIFM